MNSMTRLVIGPGQYSSLFGGGLDFCICGMPVELKTEDYGRTIKCGRAECGLEVTQSADEPRIHLLIEWNKLQRRLKAAGVDEDPAP